MKKQYLFLSVFSLCLFSSCQDDHDGVPAPIVSACGVKDPANNIPWLKDLISKAEDKINKTYNGRYTGTIYLNKYQENDVFITNMTYIGGRIAVAYDCNGNEVNFGNDTPAFIALVAATNTGKSRIIYTTFP